MADEFTPEQHKTWAELYRRQLPRVQRHACAEYLDGFERLALPAEEIPRLEDLTACTESATGWKVMRTHVRYSDAEAWYGEMAKRHFLVTDYLRSWEELDWTPEPDMFHDIFGHLPYYVLAPYTAMFELFAPAFLAATTEVEREHVKRLAWYSTEFGLIRQDGELKVFGTGLMSGGDELDKAMGGEMPLQPFSVEAVIGKDKVMYEQHDELYVLESIADLHLQLSEYFATF